MAAQERRGTDGWRPRRARGLVRVGIALLLLAGVALATGPSTPPRPGLDLVSLTDPAPPSNVTVTSKDSALVITWTAPSEPSIDSYRVYLDGVLAASPGGTSTTVNGLANGHTYVVTVTTVTKPSAGVFYEGTQASAPVSAVPRDTNPPSTPTSVTATAGDRQVTVGWKAVTNADADGYRVLRGGVDVSGLIAGIGSTSWTDTGLAADTPYTYNVQSHDTSGNWSNSSTAVTARTYDPYPPAAPAGLTATRGDGQVALTWAANTEPDLAGYRVQRNGTDVGPGTAATTFTDTGLTNDQTYAYTVVAIDTTGNRSAPSSPAVSATPTDLSPPAAPTGLAATPGNAQVALSWSPNTESDLASYRVLANGTEVATVGSGTSTTVTGLVNGTKYTFTLVAVDSHGNRSAASSAVSATPADPAPPTNVVVTPKDRALAISWTAPAGTTVASYDVYLNGVLAASPGGTSTTINGLVNGQTYVITVTSVVKSGTTLIEGSTASDPVTAVPRDSTPPATPTTVTATGGDRQATIGWKAITSADGDGYRVLRGGVDVSGLIPGIGTTSWTDTNLNAGSYPYTVQSHDTSGNWSTSSSAVTATVVDLPPAAPTGLVAARGDGRVTLSWSPNSEADLASYRVLRGGVVVATVPAGTTSYLNTGLTNDTTYSYTLVAVDGAGNASPASSPAVPATPTDLTPPAVPTGLVAAPGDGRATLTWSPNTEPDLASYRVLRGGVEVATVPAGTTTHLDTGLSDDTTYSYALAAVDTHGNRSAPSAAVSVTPVDSTPPAVPTGLTATPGDHRVTLAWGPVGDADLASYRVIRDGTEVATVSAGTSWSDTGLAEGVSHTYRVLAVDTSGNRSAPSAPVTAAPADTTAPAPPVGLTATPGDTVVSLSWTGNGEPDLASYRVLRDGTEVATVPTGTTSWTDTGLTDGTTYRYALVAVDTAGNRSAPGAPVDATPADPTAPAAPTGLTATAGDRQVALSWTANGEPDLASYRVLRGGVEVATVPVGTTTWTDVTVTNGTTYGYALVAVDTSRNRSAASATVSATPADAVAPAAPTAVAGTPGSGSATLRWVAPADADLASYRVLDGSGATVATVAAPATSATVTGLTDGTPSSFTVVAVDTSGNVGTASAAVTVTPSPAPASVPAAGSGDTGGVAVSHDGRYVVIGTKAQLEAADTNTAYELYLVDRTARSAHRIAPLAAGATGATDSTNTAAPAISDDGRYVALATTAALVPTDKNGLLDVYRYDATTGTWALAGVPAGGGVSATTAGTLLQTGAAVVATSPAVALSGDGDLVLFYSARTDLVTGDTNGLVDLFAKRMSTGAVTRVSTTSTGGNLTGAAATGPALALTPDGQYALFPVTPTSGGATLLYRKTLSGAQAGTLQLVSTVTVNGRATSFSVYRDAGDVALSADGRYVALVTANQITSATPASAYTTGLAYRVDTTSGAVLALGSGQTTVWEHQVELDPTGRYGFFATTAGELAGDTNAHTDSYRRDLAGDVAGPLVLVTADASGNATTGPSGSITSAEYGRVRAVTGDSVLVTTSQALLPSDANKLRDLYAKDLVTGAVASAL